MIRINAHYSRKVPGAQEFSSEQAGASLEIEVADAAAPQIRHQLQELWNSLRQAVDAELGIAEQPARNAVFGNGQHRLTEQTAGNGRNGNGLAAHSNDAPRTGDWNERGPVLDLPPSNSANGGDERATRKQIGFLLASARRTRNLDAAALKSLIQREFGCGLNDLSKRQAGDLIDRFQGRKSA
ncbi:MAG: hypothetical protein HS108_08095 [Planctomycetes bacterium]|nr:hypothetical protein [Planctomycetota bacterium]